MRKITHNPQFWYKPSSYDAYYYAFLVIRERCPVAELYIMKDPKWAFFYAHNVIEDRWPEAEPYIKGSKYQSLYETTFTCKL